MISSSIHPDDIDPITKIPEIQEYIIKPISVDHMKKLQTKKTGGENRRVKSKGSFKGTLTLIAGSRVSSAVLQKLCNVMYHKKHYPNRSQFPMILAAPAPLLEP